MKFSPDLTALGLVSRLEHALDRFEAELAEQRRSLAENRNRLADYEPRLGGAFALDGELAAKEAEMAALEASLASTVKDDTAGAAALDESAAFKLRGWVADEEGGDDQADEAV